MNDLYECVKLSKKDHSVCGVPLTHSYKSMESDTRSA